MSFWGDPKDLDSIAKYLYEKHPSLHLLIAKRNSGNFTYDGIELGGERVCREIEERIQELARDGRPVTKLSLIGYSLGGLIARYAIGLLYSKGVFEDIEPVVSFLLYPGHSSDQLELHHICYSSSRSKSTFARLA